MTDHEFALAARALMLDLSKRAMDSALALGPDFDGQLLPLIDALHNASTQVSPTHKHSARAGLALILAAIEFRAAAIAFGRGCSCEQCAEKSQTKGGRNA